MRHSPLNRKDPSVRADLIARRSRNETPNTIAKAYGVSRQAVNQALAELQVDSDPEVLHAKEQHAANRERYLKQREENILSFFSQGLSLNQVARRLHVDWYEVRDFLVAQGVDIQDANHQWLIAKRKRRASLLDTSYGNWTVLPDTVTLIGDKAHVQCRCVCGTERLVATNNLLSGLTTGCGCKTKAAGRRRIPWLCTQTGERFENTRAFSRHAGISPAQAQGLAAREVTYTAPNGLTYKPLVEQAVPH